MFQLSLFFLIFVVSLVILVYLLFIRTLSADPSSEAVQALIPTTAPTNEPTPATSVQAEQFVRLDELFPIEERDGNFFYNGWGDSVKFHVDDRTYSHGIGMAFSGTSFESSVSQQNSPGKITRSDCKEISIEYALRSKYSRLVFSSGIDNGDVEYFGNQESNGIAQLILSDKSSGTVIFDSGWIDYSYAIYEADVDLSNVDVLKITYRTCGVSNEYKLKKALRLAIVDPMLFLKDDAE